VLVFYIILSFDKSAPLAAFSLPVVSLVFMQKGSEFAVKQKIQTER
jgi:hypothetical protein